MFWGATLDGGKKYSQKVEQAFHLTTAALKVPVPPNDTEKFYSVYVNYNGKDFLLCSLAPSAGIYQVALGLQFETGAKLEFRVEGGGSASRVCLTGYTISSQGTPLIPTVVSTPISSSAIGVPIKVQQSILASDKKKANANQMQKRVSIRDEHEEKTFDKESGDEDDDELDSDEDEDYDEMIEEFPSDSDEDNMFDLDDSDDEGDTDELEMQQGNLEDEEESTFYGTVALANGNAEAAKVDKKKKKKQKLDFSEAESPSPKVGKAKDDKMTSTPPTKKQKLDGSKNKTPPEVMQTPEMKKKPKAPSSAGNTPMKMLTKSGVMITESKIGNGAQAKAGKKVKVGYVGRLKKNDKVFDRGDIGFHLGKSEVIKGWDIGIEGMKVGGKRKLVIPPHLAYGKNGSAPDIPPNSTLVFDVELKQA